MLRFSLILSTLVLASSSLAHSNGSSGAKRGEINKPQGRRIRGKGTGENHRPSLPKPGDSTVFANSQTGKSPTPNHKTSLFIRQVMAYSFLEHSSTEQKLTPARKMKLRGQLISKIMGRKIKGGEENFDPVTKKLLEVSKIDEATATTLNGLLMAAHVNKKQRDIILQHRLDPTGPKEVPLDLAFETHVANVMARLELEESMVVPLPLHFQIKRKAGNSKRLRIQMVGAPLAADLAMGGGKTGMEVSVLERILERSGYSPILASDLVENAFKNGTSLFYSGLIIEKP